MPTNVDGTTVVALLSVISTLILGYFGYIRSKKADTVTEKAGAVEQIISGLNTLVDNLQEDNKILRDNIKELRDALQTVTEDRDKIRSDIKDLRRKYGTSTQ